MKSIKSLVLVSLTSLSLFAVAADKPAEKKADAPAATASEPAEKKPRPKVITPKEREARKAAEKEAGSQPAKK